MIINDLANRTNALNSQNPNDLILLYCISNSSFEVEIEAQKSRMPFERQVTIEQQQQRRRPQSNGAHDTIGRIK